MDTQPQPRVEERPAFTIVGLSVDCPNFNTAAIGPLWDGFVGRLGELPPAEGLWGVSLPLHGGPGFRYLACAIVPPDTPVPAGMERVDLPGGSFAVEEFFDTMDKLPAVFQRMYGETLPAAGLASAEPFICLEYYGPGWMDDPDGRAKMTLYAGVRAAK